MWSQLARRDPKALNEEDFVNGLLKVTADLDPPPTRNQINALWRTLGVPAEMEIVQKDFISKLTPEPPPPKEVKGKSQPAKPKKGAEPSRPSTAMISPSTLQELPKFSKKKIAFNDKQMMSLFHVTLFDNTRTGARNLFKKILTKGMDEPLGETETINAEGEEVEERLPVLTRKIFKRAMPKLAEDERQNAVRTNAPVPFWACGRCGLEEENWDALFDLLDTKGNGKIDFEKTFVNRMILSTADQKDAKEDPKAKKQQAAKGIYIYIYNHYYTVSESILSQL